MAGEREQRPMVERPVARPGWPFSQQRPGYRRGVGVLAAPSDDFDAIVRQVALAHLRARGGVTPPAVPPVTLIPPGPVPARRPVLPHFDRRFAR